MYTRYLPPDAISVVCLRRGFSSALLQESTAVTQRASHYKQPHIVVGVEHVTELTLILGD